MGALQNAAAGQPVTPDLAAAAAQAGAPPVGGEAGAGAPPPQPAAGAPAAGAAPPPAAPQAHRQAHHHRAQIRERSKEPASEQEIPVRRWTRICNRQIRRNNKNMNVQCARWRKCYTAMTRLRIRS